MEKELTAARSLARERQQKISFLNAVRILCTACLVYIMLSEMSNLFFSRFTYLMCITSVFASACHSKLRFLIGSVIMILQKLITTSGENTELKTFNNRLQHKIKDINAEYRLRLTKYVEDISVGRSVGCNYCY